MALSNMINEPRREITETLVGAGIGLPIGGAWLYGIYHFAMWFGYCEAHQQMEGPKILLGVLMGLVAPVAGVGVLILAALVIHAIGEDICDGLERVGVHLRPRVRAAKR